MTKQLRKCRLAVIAIFALLCGAALVTGLYRRFGKDPVSSAIADLVRQGEGTVVEIAPLTAFEWHRLFIFGPYSTANRVNDSLGFQWNGLDRSGVEWGKGATLFVYVRRNEVVRSFDHPRIQGDFSQTFKQDGYAPSEARFVVRFSNGWPNMVHSP